MKQACILLTGFLGKESLDESLAELRIIAAENDQICIIMNTPGGNTSATLDFIEEAKKILEGKEVWMKIYIAKSSGAMIAASLGNKFEIKGNSEIGFHLPELTISTVELMNSDLSPVLRRRIEQANKLIFENLHKFKLDEDQSLIDQIMAGGWIHLSGNECLKRGVADSVF